MLESGGLERAQHPAISISARPLSSAGLAGRPYILHPALLRLGVKAVPEFFGTAQGTMIADGGWAFCEIGQFLERAIITGNAVCSIMRPMPRRNAPSEHEAEIRLSAFLRLINSRDVYRRVYQLRIEAAPMLDLLWKNPVAPRSVTRCLEACRERLTGNARASHRGNDAHAGGHRTTHSRDSPDGLGRAFERSRIRPRRNPALCSTMGPPC